MARVAILVAAAFALCTSAAEEPPAAVPANASSSQPQLRGAPGQKAAAPPSPAKADGHAERAAEVLAATKAGAKANATVAGARDGEVQAEWFDWGRGHAGETCCMCSYQYGGPTGTVVIYAAEDYDNGHFGHSAFWQCEHECERKCGFHSGGHKFGCLDEQHLRSLSSVLRRTRGFRVEHESRFGNLC